MELRQYWKIIKKYLVVIVLFAFFGGIIAFVFSQKINEGVTLQKYFYVVAPRENNSQVYNFEGFYAGEKARNFTDTAVAILESRDFINEVGRNSNSIGVRKMAPQVIRITVSANTLAAAEDTLTATSNMFNKKLIELEGDNNAIQIKEISQSAQTIPPTVNSKVTTTFGLVMGAAFALFVVGLKTYFKV